MPRSVLIVSNSTGETALRVARSALMQFPDLSLTPRRLPSIRSAADVERVVAEAVRSEGIVIFTLVDPDLRTLLQRQLEAAGIAAIDILGPVLAQLATALEADPLTVPGLQHRQDDRYTRRMAAIEYTVKHDDGAGFSTIRHAEIILVGPSRTGKTPLSIYLANGGWFVANVPFISDGTVPAELSADLPATVVGLCMTSDTLRKAREEHVSRLGSAQQQSRYADVDIVGGELESALAYYASRGWPCVDVTGKAVEEIAVEIIEHVEKRRREAGAADA